MADINDLRERLLKVREELIAALPEMALSNTLVAKGLVERKIRQIGFGAKYSENKLPAWFFLKKGKSNAGNAFVAAKEKKDNKGTKEKDGVKIYPDDWGMTWKDLRRVEGLPVDHVDLGFTNKTWDGLLPQEPYYREGRIYCPLGGSTAEVVDKLNWNRARYGDFFGKVLTEKEIEIMTAAILDDVRVILKNNGF